ncbi:MAG: polysaccharide lyase [Saccharospirillum sp.]|nr:polysaccharide lyase [Saccharospirillum sp.]
MKMILMKRMLLAMGCALVAVASGEIIVHDSFESADMSAPGYDKFSWDRNNRTSIVTMDPEATVVWNNRAIRNVVTDGRDWSAYTGDHSLRFRYPAMPNGELAEQRFFLGGAYPEIWLSWWIRVPTNFYHQGGYMERNHKLFYIWQSGYTANVETHGATIGLEFRGDGNGGSVTQGSDSVPFIDVSTDRGRWMHFVVNVKQNSENGVNDGHIKMWRKWEDESTYDVIRDRENVSVRISTIEGEEGFREGYLMGWHNGGYQQNTEWLLDDFVVSTESLFDSRPLPPINPVVR